MEGINIKISAPVLLTNSKLKGVVETTTKAIQANCPDTVGEAV